MKNYLFIISSVFVFGLFSCEEEEKSYPMTTGIVLVDSAERVAATAGTLTLAFLTGRVTNSGNLPIDRGLYIGDTLEEVAGTENPAVLKLTADRTIADADGGAGKFRMQVLQLRPRTNYFYRFYVRNYKGEALSEVRSFFSAPNLPRVTIQPAVVDATTDTIRFSGALTANGGESIFEKGFVYSLGQSPVVTDVDNVRTIAFADTNVAPFTGKISGLEKNRTYYVRTYAINRGGVNYSSQQSFKTNP